jgi:gamma-glutamylcyclotransferase (GGCT)/AIG2-like uncharacterized protein YtfP
MVYVFVYGSLRKSQSNHHYLEGAKCLAAQAWTYGELFDTGLGYPAMKLSKSTKTYGEVYQVTPEQLRHLDWLEGYTGDKATSDYDRVQRQVYTEHGWMDAFVYIDNGHSDLTPIENGDWKLYQDRIG